MFCWIYRRGLLHTVNAPASIPALGSIIPTPLSGHSREGRFLPSAVALYSQGHLPPGKGNGSHPLRSIPCYATVYP